MKTFPGWREAGRAMRWARTQDGYCHHVKYAWSDEDYSIGGEDRRVESHEFNIGDRKLVVFPSGKVRVPEYQGECKVDICGCSGAGEVLSVLAALRVVPAEFGQVTS